GIKGLVVVDVAAGSSADAAGLKAARTTRDGSVVTGDVIQAIDGRPVEVAADMDKLLDTRQPGEKVTLTLWRDGRIYQQVLPLSTPRRGAGGQ
ncbi:MAG TPA: PDZ domain-containing protein, partial [Rhodocyclaceae bacterium]|nr:PDZ domain-containing protein [Rhodocyclaceae bacterium]